MDLVHEVAHQVDPESAGRPVLGLGAVYAAPEPASVVLYLDDDAIGLDEDADVHGTLVGVSVLRGVGQSFADGRLDVGEIAVSVAV